MDPDRVARVGLAGCPLTMELPTVTGLLLVTTDPLGNIPNFISMLQPVPVERRRLVGGLRLQKQLFPSVSIRG
jgi:hypothetical protein